jgi:hypothetical protein
MRLMLKEDLLFVHSRGSFSCRERLPKAHSTAVLLPAANTNKSQLRTRKKAADVLSIRGKLEKLARERVTKSLELRRAIEPTEVCLDIGPR